MFDVEQKKLRPKAIPIQFAIGQIPGYIARRQFRRLGHVSRMPFDRLPRRLLSSWLPYKKPRGAPEMTFGKTMIKALKTFDIDLKHWPAMAANRTNCQLAP
jgi:DNA primase catalytic subunit